MIEPPPHNKSVLFIQITDADGISLAGSVIAGMEHRPVVENTDFAGPFGLGPWQLKEDIPDQRLEVRILEDGI